MLKNRNPQTLRWYIENNLVGAIGKKFSTEICDYLIDNIYCKIKDKTLVARVTTTENFMQGASSESEMDLNLCQGLLEQKELIRY